MWHHKLFEVELYYYFYYFVVFSVLGVVVEMLFCLSKEGILESRQGTLYLPLSPIYGIGGTTITVLLYSYMDKPLFLFFYAILVGSAIEYIASFVMEKMFNARFWDYSELPYNLNGRICFQYSIYWGFLGIFLMYLIVPDIYNRLMRWFPRDVGDIIAYILLPIILICFAITLLALTRLKHKVEYLSNKQNRKELSTNAFWRFIDRLAPEKLIIWTFPNLSLVVNIQRLKGVKSQKEIKIEKTIKKLNVALEKYNNLEN